MTHYNIWVQDDDRWASDLSVLGLAPQSTTALTLLTYPQAREVLEYWRDDPKSPIVWVREILPDRVSPGTIVGFNVWISGNANSTGRWTNANLLRIGKENKSQDPENPVPLTYSDAQSIREFLYGTGLSCEIMEIGSDLQPREVEIKPPQLPVPATTTTDVPVPTTNSQVIAGSPFNFQTYNGFLKKPSQVYPKLVSAIDPYTGLPIADTEKTP